MQTLRNARPTALLGAVMCLLAGLAHAGPNGSVFEFIGPSGVGKTTLIRVLHGPISPSHITIHTEGEDGAVYADLEARRVLVVDDKNKEIMDLGKMAEGMRRSGLMPNAGDVSAANAQLDAAHEVLRKQLEQMLANMPESQRPAARAALEKQFGLTAKPKKNNRNSGAMRIEQTHDTDRIQNIEVRLIQIFQGNTLLTEVWVADPDDIEGGETLVAALDALSALITDIAGDIMPSGDQSPFGGNPFLSGLPELSGFPVHTIVYAPDGSIKDETVLESASNRDLDPDAFEPPMGYRLRTMP
jgi:hypothetical protein